ncbi:MAG: beta family protein [Bacillota bacterium]
MVRYVPILKWKEAERNALRYLQEDVKSAICPVICVTKNVEVDSFPAQVIKNWGPNRQFYLDFHPTFADNPCTFIEALSGESECQQLSMIPVFSVDKPDGYLEAISDNQHLFDDIVALRIGCQDIENLEDIKEHVLDKLRTKAKDIDIILDLGQLPQGTGDLSALLATMVSSALTSILPKTTARTFIVAATSFPETLRVTRNEVSKLCRHEWLVWKAIHRKYPDVVFGDYGCDDPQDIEYPPGITIVPTIRYTKGDYWFIVRGAYDPRAPYDYAQYHSLSRKLIAMADVYCGKDYSWGDAKIYNCATRECDGSSGCHGNQKTWLEISMNHHLTYVARETARFGVS